MISDSLRSQIALLIESNNLKLYDIEFLKEDSNMILRISLFKKGGVSLEDCENISHLISPLLDVELQDMPSYNLEVSSPGIERVLRHEYHFLCSIGDKVSIRKNDKSIIKGILKNYTKDNIEVEIDNNIQIIPLKDCKKVKTYFEWKDL